MTFNQWFLEITGTVKKKSKDKSTKVGAVIVGPNKEIRSAGYNGFPKGANDDNEAWHERPKKYLVTSHAEENAIVLAARVGTPTDGCSIYITHFPCATCMRMIIQSGIKEVYVPEEQQKTRQETDFSERWKEQRNVSIEMANECGVVIIQVPKEEE